MRRKKIKLQNLDAEIRATAGDCPPIFRGVVAHVNGYTQPSLQDLHRLIVSHGGGFLQYLDGKTAATHIIASSLTPKKCEEFRRYRIVKPAWVTESIKAGRLLPWNDFRVLDEGQSQKVLKFGSGGLGSQVNTPRSGYKDHSSTGRYDHRIEAKNAVGGSQASVLSSATPSKQTGTISDHPGRPTTTPSSTRVEDESKLRSSGNPGSNQRQMKESPFHKNTTSDGGDPDELESPRKGDSARIQVDPVLSNGAHKPLNVSGSQFIMPAQPEPKPSEQTGDIKAKLMAQAKPRRRSPSPPRQMQESAAADVPPQSQLDPETLAALPEDIRKEVLSHYSLQSASSTSPTPSPAPAASVYTSHPTPSKPPGSKRPTSPAKKKSVRSSHKASGSRTLMQWGFGSSQASTQTSQTHLPGQLSALETDLEAKSPPKTSTPKRKARQSTSPVEPPDLTPHHLSNSGGLCDSIKEWCSTFETDCPYRDDVEAMSTYVRRVITEEEDVDKAVAVVRFLMGLVTEDTTPEPEPDAVTWTEAIGALQGAVQDALETMDLPPAGF